MCDVCFHAKQTRTQFQVSKNKAEDFFEIVRCDLWGPYREPSSCGTHYFPILVDDASRGVWLYLIKKKQ